MKLSKANKGSIWGSMTVLLVTIIACATIIYSVTLVTETQKEVSRVNSRALKESSKNIMLGMKESGRLLGSGHCKAAGGVWC